MKPTYLEMEAFGPFATKQAVDFNTLNQSELFLVTGATGSGKTSIFDAITFALYNKTSGDARNVNNLRSDYAPQNVECYVEFHFENKNKNYIIKRKPYQQVLGRGDKLVDRVHEVELHLPDGKIITAVEEVRQRIEKIIGLDYGRFSQIVMLPQGKFRKFLESRSSEKQDIFREVFLTHKYKDLSEYLKDDASKSLKKLGRNKEIRDTYISMIKTENKDFSSELSLKDKDVEKILEVLEKEITDDEKTYDEINEIIKITRKKQEKLDVKNAKIINEKINRLKIISEELQKLIKFEKTMEDKKIKMKLSNKALQVNVLFDRLENNIKEEKNITDQMETMNAALKESNELLEKTKQEYAKNNVREKEIENLTKDIEKINIYIRDLKAILLLDERLVNGKRLLEEIKLEKIIAEEQKIHYFYTKEKNDLETEKKDLDNIFTLKKNIELMHKKANENKRKYDNVYSLFMSGQAAMLSIGLVDGKPCDVCGSKTHPNPAKNINNIPSKEKLDEAKGIFDKSNIKFEKVSTEYKLSVKNFDEKFKSTFFKNIDNFILVEKHNENLIKKINSKKIEIDKQIKKMEDLEAPVGYIKNLENLDDTALNEKINIIISNESKYLAGIEAIENQKKEIEVELPSDLITNNEKPAILIDNYSKLQIKNENTIKSLKEQNEDVKRGFEEIRNQISRDSGMLLTLENRKKELLKNIKNDEKSFSTSLKDNNFKNKQHFLDNLLGISEIEKINKEINDYYNNEKSLINEKSILLKDVKNKKEQDIAFLEKKYNDYEKELENKEESFLSISSKLNNNKEQKENIKNILKTSAKEEEKYNIVAYLSKLANGAIGDRISFERYVLSVYFKEVIDASNLRFSKMTTNRYKMIHRKEKASYGNTSGLDLDVFDSHTGKERNIDTLSGGESFKASLSLALGLSDVIQTRAGGVHIETMFIDEGFGTLDNESLEGAINSLSELQGQGKVIGIISHIAELKERIKTHLEVTNTPIGSKIKLIEN